MTSMTRDEAQYATDILLGALEHQSDLDPCDREACRILFEAASELFSIRRSSLGGTARSFTVKNWSDVR